jgi:hypothetical protein
MEEYFLIFWLLAPYLFPKVQKQVPTIAEILASTPSPSRQLQTIQLFFSPCEPKPDSLLKVKTSVQLIRLVFVR